MKKKNLRLFKNLNCGKLVVKAENARGHILSDRSHTETKHEQQEQKRIRTEK